jgi:hypothetical protein
MTDDQTRRAELIAAALAGELTESETAELDAMRATDPTIDAEMASLDDVVARLGTLRDGWRTTDEPERVVERAINGGDAEPASVAVTPARRRRWPAVVSAAACLALGLALGVAVTRQPGPPVGPPGTLGAIEHIEFAGVPDGVRIDGDLIAHTWGTETVLAITGLPEGDAYEVVVISDDGDEYGSGTFLGSAVAIDCELNAAALREDVAAVEIRDERGQVLATAAVPPVG